MLTHTYNLKSPIAAQQNPAVHALVHVNGALLVKAKVDSFDQTLHDVDLRPGYVRLASDLSTFSTPDSFEQSGAGTLKLQDDKIVLTTNQGGVFQNQWTYAPNTGDVRYEMRSQWELDNGVTPGKVTSEQPLASLESHEVARKQELHELFSGVGRAAESADQTAIDYDLRPGFFRGELPDAGTRNVVSMEFDSNGYRGEFQPASVSVYQPYQELSFDIAAAGTFAAASSSFTGIEALTGTSKTEAFDATTGILRESFTLNDVGVASRAVDALPAKWLPESPL